MERALGGSGETAILTAKRANAPQSSHLRRPRDMKLQSHPARIRCSSPSSTVSSMSTGSKTSRVINLGKGSAAAASTTALTRIQP
jgi:hypothetical protein